MSVRSLGCSRPRFESRRTLSRIPEWQRVIEAWVTRSQFTPTEVGAAATAVVGGGSYGSGSSSF